MNDSNTAIVLGAGASRGVSYARQSSFPSPLDYDFFDLLQRLNPRKRDCKAVGSILEQVRALPREYWRTFERTFYTLHLKAFLSEELDCDGQFQSDKRIVTDFALCVHALLREAHGKDTKCKSHEAILSALGAQDSVLTFNYDLVVERALRPIAEAKSVEFADWIYGLGTPKSARKLPLLLKLHGSSNWKLQESPSTRKQKKFLVGTKAWADFDKAPGYTRIAMKETTAFPIFLPFWDKRVEEKPWIDLWKQALTKLTEANNVVVWGYSLPPTDVKAYVLFSLGLSKRPVNLCIVDPSVDTQARWRNIFPNARYWEYQSAELFLKHPPHWFELPKSV